MIQLDIFLNFKVHLYLQTLPTAKIVAKVFTVSRVNRTEAHMFIFINDTVKSIGCLYTIDSEKWGEKYWSFPLRMLISVKVRVRVRVWHLAHRIVLYVIISIIYLFII